MGYGTLQKSSRIDTKGNTVVTDSLLVVPWFYLTVPQQVLDAPPTFLPGHRECVVSGTISIPGHLSVQTQLQILQTKIGDSALSIMYALQLSVGFIEGIFEVVVLVNYFLILQWYLPNCHTLARDMGWL